MARIGPRMIVRIGGAKILGADPIVNDAGAIAECRVGEGFEVIERVARTGGDVIGRVEEPQERLVRERRFLEHALGVHGALALRGDDEREPQGAPGDVGVVPVGADALDVEQIDLFPPENAEHPRANPWQGEPVNHADAQVVLGNAHREAIHRNALVALARRQTARPAVDKHNRAHPLAAVLMRELAHEFLDSAERRMKGAGKNGDVHNSD